MAPRALLHVSVQGMLAVSREQLWVPWEHGSPASHRGCSQAPALCLPVGPGLIRTIMPPQQKVLQESKSS